MPIEPDRFEDGEPMLLGGLRRRHAFADAATGLARQWREFLAGVEPPGRIGDEYYGVMCGADASGLEYMCGVRVTSLEALPEGVGRMRVPAQRYAVFRHDGPPETLSATWQSILEWLNTGDYESAHLPDFEIYRGDPADPDQAVEIRVGVVPRRGT